MTLEEEEEYKSFKTEFKKSVSNNKVPLYKIRKKENIEHKMQFILSFILGECKDLNTFIVHLCQYKKTKILIQEILIDAIGKDYIQDLKDTYFNKGVSHCVTMLDKHFKKISPLIRGLPSITEDVYIRLVDLFSYIGTERIRFTELHLMPKLYR